MIEKPEIQYVGQFYVFGSEAPKQEPKTKKQKLKRPELHLERFQKVYINPVALCGVVVAVMLLGLLVFGAFHLRSTRAAYDQIKTHLADLKRENAQLYHTYHTRNDLEDIREQAEKIGMVKAEEAERFTVFFDAPKEEKEYTAWDDFLWLLSGLFSGAKRN